MCSVWVVAEPDDASLAEALAGEGAPSVVQLHGEESPERCSSLKQRYPHVQWWKACGCALPLICRS